MQKISWQENTAVYMGCGNPINFLNKMGALEIMIKNEETIHKLYKIYSKRFPDYTDFWWGLAVEETQHAIWIREFRSKIEEGSTHMADHRFDMNPLEKFHNYMNILLDTAEKQEMSLENALITALGIESNLIENRFFEVIGTDSEALKFVLNTLSFSTKEHLDRVWTVLDKTRKKNEL